MRAEREHLASDRSMAHWLLIGAMFGLTGVALDAVGAHGLTDEPEHVRAAFSTAIRYQMVHGLALIGVGLLIARNRRSRFLAVIGWMFSLGVVLFSGSIHSRVLLSIDQIPFAAPAGGFCLMAGWALLAIYALTIARKSGPN